MEDIIITDVEEFIAECNSMKSLKRETLEIYSYLQKIIAEANAAVPGMVTETDLLCREYVDGYPCGGAISVRKTDVPSRITWTCGSCEKQGVLINWKHIDDVQFSPDTDIPAGGRPGILRLILSQEEFFTLSSIKGLDMDSMLLVRSAVMTGSGILIYGSVHDMELVLKGITRCCGFSPTRCHSAIINKLQTLIDGNGM